MSDQEFVIACDLSALTSEERAYLETLSPELFGSVDEVRELPNGYGFRLPETFSLTKIAEFIIYDRLCCPFVNHRMEVEPRGGSIWLELSGSEGVKEFVVIEIGGNHLLRDEVASLYGFNRS